MWRQRRRCTLRAMPEPTGHVEANGVRFAYLAEGSGPLVLLLHGFPDTARTWDFVRPALAAAGYRAVSPWMRGYAPTAIPRDGRYDSETLGRDALALIDALGERQAIVLGHDWGASAAFAAAALGPERVRCLVTEAIPFPASMLPTPKMLWTVRHFFTLRGKRSAEKVRANDFAMVDELVRRWSPRWNVPPGETDAVKEAFRADGCLEAALGYYRALSPRLPAWARRPLEVPSIAFAGTDDNVSPAAYDRAARWYRAGYEVVKMPGGHFMHREHPQRFVDELLPALRRWAG